MAAPFYVTKTAFASGTNALTVAALSGAQNGDVVLLFVESANETIATPTNYTQVTNSPQSTGTAAAAGGVRLAVFYRVLTGADASTTVADSGNHTTAIKMLYRGVNNASPINVTAGSVQASAATNWTAPAVTTTDADCLVVIALANDRDLASTTNITSFTNANLTSLTERHDETIAGGVGGGLAVADGTKATAGSTGTTAIVSASSNTAAFLTIALDPAPPVTGSLAGTETGSDTLAATGEVIVQGTAAGTESGLDTFSATGAITSGAISGSLDATESGSDTFTSTGAVLVEGSLSATETGNDTLASSGNVIIQGTLDATETGADAFSANGSAVGAITGSLAVTEVGSDTIAATGSVLVSGSLAVTETGSDTFTAGADVFVAGTMAATETGSDFLGGYLEAGYVDGNYVEGGITGSVYTNATATVTGSQVTASAATITATGVSADTDATATVTGAESTATAGTVTANSNEASKAGGTSRRPFIAPSRVEHSTNATAKVTGIDLVAAAGRVSAMGTVNARATVACAKSRTKAGSVMAKGIQNPTDDQLLMLLLA